ncbi:MAG: radical SAM protein, partial [Planctomycetota bacterium]
MGRPGEAGSWTSTENMDPIAYKQIAARSEEVKELLRSCALCPRQCGIDRIAGEKGYCGLDGSARCFREMLHTAEEQELNPSHQIYFAGCNLRCEFCSVAEWNEEPLAADELDIDELSERIAHRRAQGARTLNLLGGEPTVSIYGILQLLAGIEPETKVVLNSNMYYDGRLHEVMDGLIDIYLADLKCGHSACAKELLDAEDYIDVAKENILRAYGRADVIVRHLILPGHRKCCLEPTLEWLAAELPNAKVSLRGNYA